MPLIRKVIDSRTCKAVTLPLSWLRYFEKQLGEEIHYVAMEVDREITIAPYIPKEALAIAKRNLDLEAGL